MQRRRRVRAHHKHSKSSLSAGGPAKPMADPKALDQPVPEEQWDMPAGFRPDGQIATLKEVVDPKVPTLSLGEVSPEQRADLVVKRIERQPPDFKIAMVGAGIVNKDRAIAEVKAQSKVGRVLTEIEQRLISDFIARATKGSGSKPQPAMEAKVDGA